MPCAHVISVTCDFGCSAQYPGTCSSAKTGFFLESGALSCRTPVPLRNRVRGAAASCVAHIITVRPAALHRPCRSRSGRCAAVHSPRAGGGHRAISLKKMSRSDTMPMFPNCYVGTGRALCAQCGISVNPHIRCRCTACGVRHLLRHCNAASSWLSVACRRVRFCPHCCETVSIFTPYHIM